jgi:hypothetical protein
MPESALAKKMKLKPDQKAAVIHAPEGYLKELAPLPEGVSLAEKLGGEFDWIQAFFKTQAELKRDFPGLLKALKPTGILWFCFPKVTSKIQTDLTRDVGWEPVIGADLKWVTLISINAMWSGFAVRHYKPGEPRQSFR